MLSLAFGLVAALAWGLHDFCIRFTTAKSAALSAFMMVLLGGAALLALPALALGDWGAMTPRAYALATASGLAYILGGVGLYNAFAIGPVRLVAPITAAYPVLSVGWAAANGQPVTAWQWLAVLAVVCGIGVVAFWAEDHAGAVPQPRRDAASDPRRGAAMAWAFVGALGFALTFAIGQAATLAGSELPVQLTARLAAILGLGAGLIAIRYPWSIHRPHLPLLAGMGALDVTALGFVLAAGTLDSPEFAAVAASVFGVVTILLAWRFLHEPMRLPQWGGVLAVFAGIGYLAGS